MSIHNSRSLGFYTQLLVSLHHDLVGAICLQSEIERDEEEIRRRAQHEGLTFLTTVLPSLGKSIDVSLARGTPLEFSGFKKRPGTQLPAFMHSLFNEVFRADGVPWFATWYADIHRALDGTDDVDPPIRGDVTKWIDLKPFWLDKLELMGSDELRLWLRAYDVEHSCVTQGNLYEVCQPAEVDAISVGKVPIRSTPDHSDVVLSRRREAMVVALRALRQVCYCFYKLNIPYTDEQESKVLEDFVSTDEALDDIFTQEIPAEDQRLLHAASLLVRRVLCNADPLAGRPRHGPGAVATGEKSPEKHVFKRFYERLNAVFPYDDWFYCNASHLCDSFQELQSLDYQQYGTAKVVLVPKDSRGPRLISCEPLEYQWIQQSLMRVLVDTIESHPLTKGQVNFTRQEVNRELAVAASQTPWGYVTLDMKEASDRVSLNLVARLFDSRWYQALYASRTPCTLLPDGRTVQFNKFAPMGSAVCFPVESLVFWSLCVAALMIHVDIPRETAARLVFVYGDDIVCDADYHGIIVSTLSKFGLKLNDKKCCVAGPFKESCGMDAFFGQPVTPTKIRSTWCEDPKSGWLPSYVAYANAFYREGHYQTAEWLRREINLCLKRHRMHPVPVVSTGEVSRFAFVIPNVNWRLFNSSRNIRFNRRLQRLEVKAYQCRPKSVMTQVEGYELMLRLMSEKEYHDTEEQDFLNPPASSLATGRYAIVHRNKLSSTWTPLE